MSKILHLSDIHFGRNYSEYNVDGVFEGTNFRRINRMYFKNG